MGMLCKTCLYVSSPLSENFIRYSFKHLNTLLIEIQDEDEI